jgi:CelD/BcsL family acetyltransferase involved in cellulose biosynthesis
VASSVAYDEITATVHRGRVSEDLAREADRLYGSLYSTLDYIAAYDKTEPDGVVVLEQPRHVLLYRLAGRTIDVLTRRFEIAPADVRRACLALTRAFPETQRIHVEVPFAAHELGLPHRVLATADDMVVALPGSVEAYLDGLGKSTRRNLRTYESRVRRAYPDLVTEVSPVGERASELFELYMTWKRQRFSAMGRTVYFDRIPDVAGKFTELLRRRGELHLTSAGGRPVALVFAFPVGPATWLQQYAYDLELEYYHLGLLSQYWAVADAIARDLRRVSMFYGTAYYKERLGARPSPGTQLSVFPSQLARLSSLGEASEVARRRLRERVDAMYWRARHSAGRTVRGFLHRPAPDNRPAADA